MRVVFAAVLLTACTKLGRVPATTGVSAVPADRPALEAQLGAVPAFLLSQSAQDVAKGRRACSSNRTHGSVFAA